MPGEFDVMSNKHLWDRSTRKVIEARVSSVPAQTLFSDDELRQLDRIIEAVVPGAQALVPIKEVLGSEFGGNPKKGVRLADLPWRPEMYKKGLASLEKEAGERFRKGLVGLSADEVAELLGRVSRGEVRGETWEFPAGLFFRTVVEDIVAVYYAFPQSWNEIRFAGPSYPYGYYELDCGSRMHYEPELGGENRG